MKGTGTQAGALAREIGVDASTIAAWQKYVGTADDAQARAIARILRLDPGALADSAAKRWHPPHIAPDDVSHHPQDPHPSNGYVFFLDGGRRSALVDPAGIPANLLRVLRDGDYHLQYILITHKHADHCDATGRRRKSISTSADRDARARRGRDRIARQQSASRARRRGASVRRRRAASACFTRPATRTARRLTSFDRRCLPAIPSSPAASAVRSATRARMTTSSTAFARSSSRFPNDTVVMPGHGPPTTIALEREHNPFFARD